MSFIDLMADHRWSEADIVNRTEAMVRKEFTAEAERILSRKVLGAGMGYIMTAAEQAEVGRFQATVFAAQAEGNAARADMALLEAVLALEAAQARLALPAVEPVLSEPAEGEPEVTNQAELDADTAERASAQATVDAASPVALALAAERAARRAPSEAKPVEEPVA